MRLLIDGDVIAYRAGFASEKTKYLVTDATGLTLSTIIDDAKTAKTGLRPVDLLWSRKDVQPVEQAILIADVMLSDIRARYYTGENDSTHVFLSGVGNFRNSVATRATYKGNRSGSVPPTHLRAIHSHLIDKHGAVVSRGEEADDLIGIFMTQFKTAICCSIDKDLMQLPGRHYNFVTKEEVTISQKQAALNFYAQVLSGDSVDNVPGIPGIGPVKAHQALADCKTPADCWKVCREEYFNEFGDKGDDYAIETARLVYVRRTLGELWSPPNTIQQEVSKVETPKTEELPKPKGRSRSRVPVSA